MSVFSKDKICDSAFSGISLAHVKQSPNIDFSQLKELYLLLLSLFSRISKKNYIPAYETKQRSYLCP